MTKYLELQIHISTFMATSWATVITINQEHQLKANSYCHIDRIRHTKIVNKLFSAINIGKHKARTAITKMII